MTQTISQSRKHKQANKQQENLQDYLPIRDYALIGDLHTVALVGKNGSIDWFCLPRIDSPSVFGGLLDVKKGGRFRIAPSDPATSYQQLYYPNTNVLLTRFVTATGFGELTDLMPIQQSPDPELEHTLLRSITAVDGSLEITLVCRPAFNYTRESHQVRREKHGISFISQGFTLALASPHRLEEDGQGGVIATFTLRKGQSAHFLLKSIARQEAFPEPLTEERYQHIFRDTLQYWYDWIGQCRYQGRWRETVYRSALALKLMTYAPTGALVAAPTTSLPETLGGVRNWDYRFTWLRDSAFTLESLLKLGFTEETRAFGAWLNDRIGELKKGGMLQPMYGIDGEHDLTEMTLDHLEGYMGSSPVRIGNGAYTQKQLDTYGEIMQALALYDQYDAVTMKGWECVQQMMAWLSKHWQEKDEGIWEVRGGQQYFLHSRLMCWVAFDRAIRIAQARGWPGPIHEWERIRSEIYTEIRSKGWNQEMQSFVQYYGSDVVDASTLLMLLYGFAGPHDPQMLSTIERIKNDLSIGASVLRYDPKKAADDGLEGSVEGAFSACSFWLVECLARSGQLFEARIRLEKLLSLSNHVGLYAEEIGSMGYALGNFPQAFTHLALITACLALDEALNAQLKHPGWVRLGR